MRLWLCNICGNPNTHCLREYREDGKIIKKPICNDCLKKEDVVGPDIGVHLIWDERYDRGAK